MSLPTILAAGGLQILGFATQTITIVYWTSAAISQYGILLYANIFFPLVFGAVMCYNAYRTGNWRALLVADDPGQRSLFKKGSLMQIACISGLFNILNGFLIVYASSPIRTPPLIQAILQNAAVLFSIPCSKLILNDNKKYASLQPLIACALVVASIIVSVLPLILTGQADEGFDSASAFGWIAVYFMGLLPGAAYNVMQQRFLIESKVLREGVTAEEVALASTRLLFYSNIWQTFWCCSMFWVDILPWFGASTNISEFWGNLVFSISCSFGGPGAVHGGSLPASQCVLVLPNLNGATPPPLPIFSYGFVFGYIMSYVGAVILNRESATFALLINVASSCVVSAFFLIPGTNPNNTNTPVWSVLVSLLLSLSGLVVFKRWEMATPSHQQFELEVQSTHIKPLLGGRGDEQDWLLDGSDPTTGEPGVSVN